MARNRLCAGIDIGASSVKLCQLRPVKRGYTLDHFGEVPLPPDTLVDGVVMSSAHLLASLRSLLHGCPQKPRRVAVAVSGQAVIIKTISLPQMGRDELDSCTSQEAAPHVPFDINDVYVDLQILGPTTDARGKMDVLLVAAKKEHVNEYTSVLVEAGLDPVICDIEAFAVQTLFEESYTPLPGDIVALCNIGAVKTNFSVLAADHSRFTRDVAWGAARLTAEMQKYLGINFAEAEQLKVSGKVLPPPLSASLTTLSEDFASELLRSIDYYTSSHGDRVPTRVMVCGGGANDARLMQALTQRIALPIEVLGVGRKLVTTPQNQPAWERAGAAAAVATGLAMRYPGDA